MKFQKTKIKVNFWILICNFALCILHFAFPVYAQEESIICNGDRVEYFEQEKKVVGEGNVVITYKDMRLNCDKIEIFTETKDAIAYGNVRLYQDSSVFSGETLYYNFDTKKGRIIQPQMSDVGPWYGGGEEADRVDEKRFIIRQGYITTCDKDKPHYRIKAREIKITLGERVVARDVVFMLGNIPLMYLPYYSHPLDDNRPRLTLIPGRSKEWGFYVLTAWRYYFSEEAQGRLHLDYREKKGFAQGVDHDYILKNFGQGRFRYYYMKERDKTLPKPLRRETERFRVQLKHAWRATEVTQLLLEYHRMSDKDFIKDYFFREEYEKESQPKSYLSIITAKPQYTFSALLQKRTNRFFTETEKLPQLTLNIKSQPINESPFYYKGDFDLANLTNKNANSDIDDDVGRFDAYNQFSYLRKIGFVSITPYVGLRQSYFSKDKYGDEHLLRTIFYSGLDASTKFYRVYDIETNWLNLDIHKLRHIITPTINYRYIHTPTVIPDRLMGFDSIDSIDRDNTITLTLENRLQTKRKKEEGEFETVELGTLLFSGDYNFKPEIGSHWSNFKFDLELNPYNWLRFESDATYDPPSRDFQTVNFDLVMHKDRWSLGLGSRYQENSFNQLTSQFMYKLSPRWTFRAYQRFNFKKILDSGKKINDFEEQEYALVRDLHCWTAELVCNIKDTTTIWVIFRIKAFPEVPFRFSTTYHAPKTTSESY